MKTLFITMDAFKNGSLFQWMGHLNLAKEMYTIGKTSQYKFKTCYCSDGIVTEEHVVFEISLLHNKHCCTLKRLICLL